MIAVRLADIEIGPRREITLQAAADGLDGIVAEATAGEDVVITRDRRPLQGCCPTVPVPL